jgi:hypothetical protein
MYALARMIQRGLRRPGWLAACWLLAALRAPEARDSSNAGGLEGWSTALSLACDLTCRQQSRYHPTPDTRQ